MQITRPSVLIRILWMMRCVEWKKNNKKILRLLFSELSWKIHRKFGWWRHKKDQKMTITQKIKIGKIWNLIFLSVQPIPDLSCEFEHFWHFFWKFFFSDYFYSLRPHQKASRVWEFFLGLVDSSRNRLVWTAYQKSQTTVLSCNIKIIFFFKIDKMYMKNSESAK